MGLGGLYSVVSIQLVVCLTKKHINDLGLQLSGGFTFQSILQNYRLSFPYHRCNRLRRLR